MRLTPTHMPPSNGFMKSGKPTVSAISPRSNGGL
jgi:hypothetical protein